MTKAYIKRTMNNIDNLKEELIAAGETLRKKNGLYVASNGPHYIKYTWLRDNYYQVKPFLDLDPEAYVQTYQSIAEYILGLNDKYDDKLNWLIYDPANINSSRFIHPRWYGETGDEITSDWGNLQLDTFGYFLFGIAEGFEAGFEIPKAKEASEYLIKILNSINYWTIQDNGIWEETLEVHASSIGAVVAGLKKYVEAVDPSLKDDNLVNHLIEMGERTLDDLLINESETKSVDLALLTLIYPFNCVDEVTAGRIINNVTKELERPMGVIRYHGDAYYNTSGGHEVAWHSRLGSECEWCMGFAFLAHAHAQIGNFNKAITYYNKLVDIHYINDNEGIPEGYYAGTKKPNDNKTLGWPTAMTVDFINMYIDNSNLLRIGGRLYCFGTKGGLDENRLYKN